MTITINHDESPAARIAYADQDMRIHIFDSMGDAWCEDEELSADGAVPEANISDDDEWCEKCIESGMEEGLVVRS